MRMQLRMYTTICIGRFSQTCTVSETKSVTPFYYYYYYYYYYHHYYYYYYYYYHYYYYYYCYFLTQTTHCLTSVNS